MILTLGIVNRKGILLLSLRFYNGRKREEGVSKERKREGIKKN
jgi:hypothetical protein